MCVCVYMYVFEYVYGCVCTISRFEITNLLITLQNIDRVSI